MLVFHVRCVFPAQTLVLLRELVRFGSDRVVEETRDHMYNLRGLENFRYQEEGKEKGNGIREISKVWATQRDRRVAHCARHSV